MTKLSLWAKHHSARARTVIVLLHAVLNSLAVYTGFTLLQLGQVIPSSFVYVTMLLFFTAVFLYPSAQQRNIRFNKRRLYIIRKSCDFALCACSFILVCFTANNYCNYNPYAPAFTAGAAVCTKGDKKPGAEEILASLAHRDKSSLTRSEKRILRNEFKLQLKVYVKAKLTKDDEAAAKAIFITLSIIGAVGLTFLLAGLACSISCNGSEAGAILVMILGLTAIICLLIVAIKKIKSHKKKEKNTPEVKPA
jgi:hypothetical protein